MYFPPQNCVDIQKETALHKINDIPQNTHFIKISRNFFSQIKINREQKSPFHFAFYGCFVRENQSYANAIKIELSDRIQCTLILLAFYTHLCLYTCPSTQCMHPIYVSSTLDRTLVTKFHATHLIVAILNLKGVEINLNASLAI